MSEEGQEGIPTPDTSATAAPRRSRVDRRRFLEAAGASGVGLTMGTMLGGPALGVAQAGASSAPTTWDMTADVVVVGTGAAGFAAAATAHSKGNSVIMLEKGPIYGGTTAKSGGEYWIPNNSLLRAAGLTDPKVWALRYMARLAYPTLYNPNDAHLGLPPLEYSLIETFYDRGPEAIDYFEHIGAVHTQFNPDYPTIANYGGNPNKPTYKTNNPDYHAELAEDKRPQGRSLGPTATGGGGGAGLITQFYAWATAKKIPVLLEHAVTKVYRNTHGQVIGVAVNAKGKTLAVRARKAVVFGSGGFTANKEMARNFLRGPVFGGCGVPTNTGDIVPIASELGADFGNMNNAWWLQLPLEIAVTTVGSTADIWIPYGDSMIQVNKYGRRVVNEKAVYNERSQIHHVWDPSRTEYPNLVLFMIYDDAVAKNPTQWAFRGVVPMPGNTAPYVIMGNTLDELARKVDARLASLASHTAGLKLDRDFTAQLRQTIMRYNSMAGTGVDTDFQRGSTPIQRDWGAGGRKGLKNPTMAPISGSGPYYCILVCGATLDTKGGPKINAKAQIIDPQAQPIPGLYGAGNCIASPAGQAYWSGGGTIGPAMVYGYLAGFHAAAEPVKDV
ncbi:MAG: fumarate reductase/succinate dehydrogenase flavoprotein domain protein [Chloroflexi bacterium]|nr:fumarate reductase/succinate dehydrogenase flavoprotein domain protein [Chloroflexota bacterium]